MSTLPIDTALRFPHLFVIPASAGSGKTYTLAHRYAQFLLSATVPANGLRNILAVTFTKLAAKEMKERILLLLKQAALRDPAVLADLSALVSLPPEETAARARARVDEILRDYSDFNVRTIDSFLTTVFKASALELGAVPDASVEFDHDAVIEQAFREFSQTMREGSDALRFVSDLIAVMEGNEAPGKGFLWNPYAAIVRQVRELQTQFARFAADPSPAVPPSELPAIRARIIERSAAIGRMLAATTLPVYVHFRKDVERLASGDVHETAMKGKFKRFFNKYTDDDGAKREVHRLFAVIRPLEEDLERYVTVHARSFYQPFVRAAALASESVRRVKLREGAMMMDDVNRSLAQYLSGDVVPEVYLKLGERIAHFMIDEFQDTSPVQWRNLFPLIEEALAKQGSLFAVGDTKQSIYGFRGADWHIFRDLSDGKYFPSAPAEMIRLERNFRSTQVLVDFVKEVFSANVAAAGLQAHAAASGLYNFAQDVPDAQRGKGYVEVKEFGPESEEGARREYVVSCVRDAAARGFAYGDIAVLTQTNADVVEISGWLNAEGIPFLSMSTLDIRKRKAVGEIIALLRFLDSPIDDLSFATLITGTLFSRAEPELTPERMHAFLAECRASGGESGYRAFRERYRDAWDRCFDRLFALVGYMPLYDLVSEAFKTFRIFERLPSEESSFVKFLECVKEFERSGSNSLKDFLTFASDEGTDLWSIDVPRTVHDVRVMTVHKAKGLGFPVVVAVLAEKRPRTSSMVVREGPDGLEVLRVLRSAGERSAELAGIAAERETEAVIDELNKTYVALTRAREEMYVALTVKKKEHLPASILHETAAGSKTTSVRRREEPYRLPVRRPEFRMEIPPLAVAPHERIGLRETRRGDAIHELLSRIEFLEEDAGEAVRAAADAAAVPPDIDLAAETAAVVRFLQHPAVREFFERRPGRVVLREQEAVAPNGRLFRMDRIVADVGRVTVVDFKTGGDEHQDEYEVQVRQYMTLLRDLYPGREVAGALLYVDLLKGAPVI